MLSRQEIEEEHPEMLAEYEAQTNEEYADFMEREAQRQRVRAQLSGDKTDEFGQPLEE